MKNVEHRFVSFWKITEKEGESKAGTLHARHLGYMAACRVTRKHRLQESINQMLINVKL